MISIHIDEAASERLEIACAELNRSAEDLARAALEESLLDYFRHRRDDPGRGVCG